MLLLLVVCNICVPQMIANIGQSIHWNFASCILDNFVCCQIARLIYMECKCCGIKFSIELTFTCKLSDAPSANLSTPTYWPGKTSLFCSKNENPGPFIEFIQLNSTKDMSNYKYN